VEAAEKPPRRIEQTNKKKKKKKKEIYYIYYIEAMLKAGWQHLYFTSAFPFWSNKNE
jgi:hypothetical protein